MSLERQIRALRRLEQIKRLNALAERRAVAEALAQVTAADAHLSAIDDRVATERAAAQESAGITDALALGHWQDLTDRQRTAVLEQRIMAERSAEALATKAVAAEQAAEVHKELLGHLTRKRDETRRRREQQEDWNTLAAALASGPETPQAEGSHD